MFRPSIGDTLMFSQCKPIPCCSYLMKTILMLVMLMKIIIVFNGESQMVSHCVLFNSWLRQPKNMPLFWEFQAQASMNSKPCTWNDLDDRGLIDLISYPFESTAFDGQC